VKFFIWFVLMGHAGSGIVIILDAMPLPDIAKGFIAIPWMITAGILAAAMLTNGKQNSTERNDQST
jgi:hypothetical protein